MEGWREECSICQQDLNQGGVLRKFFNERYPPNQASSIGNRHITQTCAKYFHHKETNTHTHTRAHAHTHTHTHTHRPAHKYMRLAVTHTYKHRERERENFTNASPPLNTQANTPRDSYKHIHSYT